MPLQLANYTDRFGNNYPAAYAVIEAIYTPVPPSGLVETTVRIWRDEAAFTAALDYVFEDFQDLAFNPFANGAGNAAYTALSNAGGIYAGSTIVP